MKNTARAKLLQGAMTTLIDPRHPSPGLAQFLGQLGFDMIFLDCEAGSAGLETVDNMARAVRLAGSSPLVRVEAHEEPLIARYLARQIDGLIFPHVDDAATANRLSQAVRLSKGGEDKTVIVMIESVEAIGNLDGMLDVPGIDALFVGSADLAHSMGHAWQGDHPAVIEATASIARRCRAKGRIVGARVSEANAQPLLGSGITLAYLDAESLIRLGQQAFQPLLEKAK